MSAELDPPELAFRRPFTHEVTQVLRIYNPNDDPIAFKVKTTAPKQYCVRPNSGKVDPGDTVKVQVLLQAMERDPPLDTRCKDKFLVQSVAVTDDRDFGNVAAMWSHIEQTAKSLIQEKKIRVLFLPPLDSPDTPAHRAVNGSSYGDEYSMASSPSSEAITTPRGAVTGPSRDYRTNEEEPTQPVSAGQPSEAGSVISSVKNTIANVVPSSVQEAKAQLPDPSAMASSIKRQAEQGLRQRKADTGTQDAKGSAGMGTTTVAPAQNSPTGVPIQIVAGLCLLSFLLAYFFF